MNRLCFGMILLFAMQLGFCIAEHDLSRINERKLYTAITAICAAMVWRDK